MEMLFDSGWQFAKLHIENEEGADGKPVFYSPDEFYPKAGGLDYSSVCLPHDYLIFQVRDLYENSVGFYRKRFVMEELSERTALRFEGVYMNSVLWVNGQKAFEWKYGYTAFEADITPFVRKGDNLVELVCVYQSPNSRWYSGAGIYRDVYLVQNSLPFLVGDGVYFSARKIEGRSYGVHISCELAAGIGLSSPDLPPGCSLSFCLERKNGSAPHGLGRKVWEASLGSGSMVPLYGKELSDYRRSVSGVSGYAVLRGGIDFEIDDVLEWEPYAPNLYTLTVSLLNDGALADSVSLDVGFRDIVMDADRGLFINGKPFKINGVCGHHDLGALGAAFDREAVRRKALVLRRMGVNAVRTSHNPVPPAYLDLMDRMGFLVDSEGFDMWQRHKTTYDYAAYFDGWHERDVSSWVRQARNHPSVFMWSIGNEIYDTHLGSGLAVTKDLKAQVRRWDPLENAAVTIGSNYMAGDGAQECAKLLDAAGYNYLERLFEDHHAKYPDWKIYGSETSSTVQSRGVYHFPLSRRLLTHADLQCSTLGNCTTNWGAANSSFVVSAYRDRPFTLGQFIWTGWDYIGEPTPYQTKNSYFGQLDTAGFPKDTFYVYKAGWTDYKKDPFVRITPYWDFNEGQLVDIRAYSNAPRVDILVNGKLAAKFSRNPATMQDLGPAVQVAYAKGEITAVAYDERGREIARDSRRSFGDAARLCIREELENESTDRGGRLRFFDIYTVDAGGNECENARNELSVMVCGAARLEGLDNGDSTDYDEYKSPDGRTHTRRLFSNRLLAIVRTDGPDADFSIAVTGPGLARAGMEFRKGTAVEGELPDGCCPHAPAYVPVRKIELSCTEGGRKLSSGMREALLRARIYPENASDRKLSWKAVDADGVRSLAVSIQPSADGLEARIVAEEDGDFRLTCSASNGRSNPEVLSELEFSVSGLGRKALDPYAFIYGCRCSRHSGGLQDGAKDAQVASKASQDGAKDAAAGVKLSFDGGIFTDEGRACYTFDRVDFGRDGADRMTVPIFHWDDELPLEIWDGSPEDGRLLFKGEYRAKSVYNVYSPNTFCLSRRLFGLHSISFVTFDKLSLHGFSCPVSPKARAYLHAADSDSITGDSFRRQDDGTVSGIGNNVSLVFSYMDFGTAGGGAPGSLVLEGFARSDNTVRLVVTAEDGSQMSQNLEFPRSRQAGPGYVVPADAGASAGGSPQAAGHADSVWEKRTYSLAGFGNARGMCEVAFIFLPGSDFDFRGFQFG